MDRKEFLGKLGIGAAFVLTSTCLGSCSDSELEPEEPVDFTLDLSDQANAGLTNNGGYIIKNRVVVAKDNDGNYVAATEKCSHEGLYDIVFSDNEWKCTAHQARFSINGEGLNENGKRDLTVYEVELTGTMLRVYSL